MTTDYVIEEPVAVKEVVVVRLAELEDPYELTQNFRDAFPAGTLLIVLHPGESIEMLDEEQMKAYGWRRTRFGE